MGVFRHQLRKGVITVMQLMNIHNGQFQRHPINEAVFMVGADKDCDVCISGKGIPQIAIKLEQVDGKWTAENVEKNKRVRLNGDMLKKHAIVSGDRLEVCEQVFIPMPEIKGMDEDVSSAPEKQNFEALLQRFAEVAASEPDMHVVLHNILKLVVELTGGTEAILFTLDSQKQSKVTVSHGVDKADTHFSDTIVQSVLNSGKGMVIPNALADPDFGSARSVVDLCLQTVLCVPVRLADALVGLLYVGCRKPEISYSEADLSKLNIYALLAGMIIHNVEYITRQKAIIKRLSSIQKVTGIISDSPVMQRVLDRVKPVACSEISILLLGETGTGKDVIASYIHQKSDRAGKPFVAVNCSALRGGLLESELLGHKKGAFTGALSDKPGLFKAAHGGTLFLDEIGEMEMGLQAKLLRVLETGLIRPVGDVREFKVDVRVLSATNVKLEERVHEKTFRQDLYYRLAQMTVTLPPLRERGEDILLLAHYYLGKFKDQYPEKKAENFHPDAIKSLMAHQWPGNVREMVNVIHRSFLMSTGPFITLDDEIFNLQFAPLDDATKKFQRDYINKAIALNNGKKEKAAEILGVSRSTFFRYLSQLEIS